MPLNTASAEWNHVRKTDTLKGGKTLRYEDIKSHTMRSVNLSSVSHYLLGNSVGVCAR